MKESAKYFFVAVGSILDISPANSYIDNSSITSDMDLMYSDWVHVGDSLREAIADHDKKKITAEVKHSSATQTC